MTQPHPKRQLTVQSSIFNQEDLEYLMQLCETVVAQGYNRMLIEFKNGHPDIYEERRRHQTPRTKQNKYQAE